MSKYGRVDERRVAIEEVKGFAECKPGRPDGRDLLESPVSFGSTLLSFEGDAPLLPKSVCNHSSVQSSVNFCAQRRYGEVQWYVLVVQGPRLYS